MKHADFVRKLELAVFIVCVILFTLPVVIMADRGMIF